MDGNVTQLAAQLVSTESIKTERTKNAGKELRAADLPPMLRFFEPLAIFV